jgi:uracil-DNA glycosylase
VFPTEFDAVRAVRAFFAGKINARPKYVRRHRSKDVYFAYIPLFHPNHWYTGPERQTVEEAAKDVKRWLASQFGRPNVPTAMKRP